MSQNLPLLMAVCNVASAREKKQETMVYSPFPPKKQRNERVREKIQRYVAAGL